ncbi:MAG TPA: type II toxin-antitoxin system VapC family toxin [Desulfuromonadales bacterium]|nr:type II toxin-antitoxin system VapC family toxin [Desulfuromonadales bacterium]
MSCLLDTHALLWTLFDPSRLGTKATDCIQNPDVTVSVSIVSLWEISLKYATGKLELSGVVPDDFPAIVRQSGFELLPIDACDAATFHHLPRMEHKDPFDRLIIWQAISHKLTLISHDSAFAAYRKLGLKVLW